MFDIASVFQTIHLVAAIASEGQEINEAAIGESTVFTKIWKFWSSHSNTN
jgi:hypothetical protein